MKEEANSQCSNCGATFAAKGQDMFMVLTGGRECPKCKGKVDRVIARVRP